MSNIIFHTIGKVLSIGFISDLPWLYVIVERMADLPWKNQGRGSQTYMVNEKTTTKNCTSRTYSPVITSLILEYNYMYIIIDLYKEYWSCLRNIEAERVDKLKLFLWDSLFTY